MTAPQPEDFETWLMSWARQRETKAYEDSWTDRCPLCRHPFHGLPCTADSGRGCRCPTALEEAS